MGVSGCGKTTVGKILSAETGIPFYDGDDFHPEENIEKMKSGQALVDEDRWAWLEAINAQAKAKSKDQSIIIACSALKEKYRELLEKDLGENCTWIHLNPSKETIASRLENRTDHFMPPVLLSSQFEALEPPSNALVLDNKHLNATLLQILDLFPKKQLGFLGLGIMGKSLSRNLAGKGFSLSLYNRHLEGFEEKVAEKHRTTYSVFSDSYGFDRLDRLCQSLSKPRKILMMIPAGKVIDDTISFLSPYLEAGDILIDAGNSHFKDTERRQKSLSNKGIGYLGIGVSGGELGALNGPSIMPSGDLDTYKLVQPYLEGIAAKSYVGDACCSYIGKGGAGHFVKMVHNGIEYGEMQLLAEVYAILNKGLGYSPEEASELLGTWRESELDSYLLEITATLLKKKEGEKALIDLVLDKAKNKGTGAWTTIAASELGMAIPTITAALYARFHSAFKNERVNAAELYASSQQPKNLDLRELFGAYKMARIINHHEGFQLIGAASKEFNWNINMSELAGIWTEGCIIRSKLMQELGEVFKSGNSLLVHNDIKEKIAGSVQSLKDLVSKVALSAIPIPCLSAALQSFNNRIEAESSANLIQAQRDYFGAHRYQRNDKDQNETFHSDWSE